MEIKKLKDTISESGTQIDQLKSTELKKLLKK